MNSGVAVSIGLGVLILGGGYLYVTNKTSVAAQNAAAAQNARNNAAIVAARSAQSTFDVAGLLTQVGGLAMTAAAKYQADGNGTYETSYVDTLPRV